MLDKNDVKQIKTIVVESENRIDKKFERLDGKVDRLDDKVAILDGKFEKLDGKVDRLDDKVAILDGKFEKLDKKVVTLDEKIDLVKNEIIATLGREVSDLAEINREVIKQVDLIGKIDKRVSRLEVKVGFKPL